MGEKVIFSAPTKGQVALTMERILVSAHTRILSAKWFLRKRSKALFGLFGRWSQDGFVAVGLVEELESSFYLAVYE